MNVIAARRLLCLSVFSVFILLPDHAEAYNWNTHSRIIEVAMSLMQNPSIASSTAPPTGVDPTQWANYLAAIQAGYSNIGVLQTGLQNPAGEDTCLCQYQTTDDMSQIPTVRIEDLHYWPMKGQNLPNQDPIANGTTCSEEPIPQPLNVDIPQVAGKVLGWQGASVDEHLEDSVLWYRPTSAGFLGQLNQWAAQASTDVVAALALPFICIADLFSGGNCLNQAFDLGNEINPVTQTEGWLPGFGDETSYDYVGLWHFIDVRQSGFYNTTPGICYENAGPHYPGALDVGIMVLADLSGLSLDAYKSMGPSRYGQFDQKSRDTADWQFTTLGHTEFSPISNLAQYGWTQFQQQPTTAYWLSWPLHALGDAAEPQHVAGTTSWGHRPYEDETDNNLDQLLPSSPNIDPAAATLMLQLGFTVWSKYQSQFAPNQVPVQDIITDEANQTWTIMEGQAETAYNDGASVQYFVGDQGGADSDYASSVGNMQPPLQMAVGYVIAFLTGVSQTAQDPGPNTNFTCPNSMQWDFHTQACDIPGPTIVCGPQPTNPGPGCPATNSACGSSSSSSGGAIPCGNAALVCTSSSECQQGYQCVLGAGGVPNQGCCEAPNQ